MLIRKTPIVFKPRLILLKVSVGCIEPSLRNLFEEGHVHVTPISLNADVQSWLEENECVATFRGNILFRTEEQRVEFVLRFGGEV